MEIGSFFEIAPDSTAGGEKDPVKPKLCEIEKYGKRNCRFTASGREAITLALESIARVRPALPRKCMLPAYMCDSVFQPFVRAGWEIVFYHVERNLAADGEKLNRQTEETGPCLLFVHAYYGVDTWKAARPFFREWRERGICIMEDVTQSYYLKDAGKGADYVVGSLRKWYPVPDGGFVASDDCLLKDPLIPDAYFTKQRLEFQQEKWNYLHKQNTADEKRMLKENFLRKNREMEEWLDQHTGIGALSGEAAAVLEKTDEMGCRKKRNANYRYLYRKITGKTQFGPVLSVEDEDIAPLYLAIYAHDRDGLQGFLKKHDIYAPVLWPVGKENEDLLTDEERYIYDHMLALPIDQRYGTEQMRYIAEVMERYEEQETRERIGIRADANETVATGHIMRCITIAKQLILQGKRVLFFTADEYGQEFLKRAELESVCLHTDWNRMEEETNILCDRLKAYGCKKLLVDSYQVTEGYFEKLKHVCKLIYIDDCFDGVYPVDMLINYNAYHVRFPYGRAYGNGTKLLLGTAYVPLRGEFGRKPDIAEDGETLQVLLCVGGGDRYHALEGILAEAPENAGEKEVVFHAVLGRFCEGKEELERLAKMRSNIRLHCNVNNMAELMGRCDAAVSAAGTMLFELSAMQVPTVFFVSADNQQYDREFFAKEGRMLFAGDIRRDRRQCLGRIRDCLKCLLEDKGLCAKMRAELLKVTDGRGAERIAREIVNLDEKERV